MTDEPCHVCEGAEWMALAGEVREQAARRLGMTPAALERHLRRHDRADLWRALPQLT